MEQFEKVIEIHTSSIQLLISLWCIPYLMLSTHSVCRYEYPAALDDCGPDADDPEDDHREADELYEADPVVVVANNHKQGAQVQEDHAIPGDCARTILFTLFV